MTFLLAILLWGVLIAGALPRAGHHGMEGVLPFWDARWASLVSSALEILLGITLFLPAALLQIGLEDAVSSGGVFKVLLAAFLPVEGFIRLAGTVATSSSVASLPVLVVWRAVAAVAGLSKRGTRSPGAT
jgi:hypothetical protein